MKINTGFKRMLAAVLCISVLMPFSGAAATGSDITGGFGKVENGYSPEGIAVSSVNDFIGMKQDGIYYLANDIDFGGTEYKTPIYTGSFTGVLDGNGHSLLGINIKAAQSDAGIFSIRFGGTLKNITIGSEDRRASVSSTGGGYSVACIAGTVVNGASFSNIRIYADVAGEGKTAGFTSYMPSGTLTIEGCEVDGSIKGNPAAGFVTMSPDGSSEIKISGSVNNATVAGRNLGGGGFYCTASAVGSTRVCKLSIAGCVNRGAISATDWRVGGIVGEFNESVASTLSVEYCYNTGAVTMNGGGGYAAGIVGGASFDAPTGKRIIRCVYNSGPVRNTVALSRAFGIAFANTDGENNIIENAFCTDNALSFNMREINSAQLMAPSEFCEMLTAIGVNENNTGFVADTDMNNGGFPLLSWEVLCKHSSVKSYKCGLEICELCGKTLSTENEVKHSFEKNETEKSEWLDAYTVNKCIYCGYSVLEVAEECSAHVKPDDNGVYVISRAAELMWYAGAVNLGILEGKEKLSLGADIDLTGYDFTPIGYKDKVFKGIFDGSCHIITGLTVKGSGDKDNASGLFGSVGMCAQIINTELVNVNISSAAAAGALIGEIAKGAVVRVSGIIVRDSSIVTSGKTGCGAVIGSSGLGADTTVLCCAVQRTKVEGSTCGGIIGDGGMSTIKNCFVSAELKADNGKTASLANGSFTEKNCCYDETIKASQKDGAAVNAGDIAGGKVCYDINTLGAQKIFGLKEGSITFSNGRIYLVRQGSKKLYTNNALKANGNFKCYTSASDKGILLTVITDKSGDREFYDEDVYIKPVGGDYIKIDKSAFVLSGCLIASGKCFVASDGYAMYTALLENNASVESVKIGSNYNESAVALTAG